MLLPVSGLLQIGRLSIADRYTYLPAIGFYLIVVWGIAELLAVLFSEKICRCAGNCRRGGNFTGVRNPDPAATCLLAEHRNFDDPRAAT